MKNYKELLARKKDYNQYDWHAILNMIKEGAPVEGVFLAHPTGCFEYATPLEIATYLHDGESLQFLFSLRPDYYLFDIHQCVDRTLYDCPEMHSLWRDYSQLETIRHVKRNPESTYSYLSYRLQFERDEDDPYDEVKDRAYYELLASLASTVNVLFGHNTPLHKALMSGNLNATRALVQYGAHSHLPDCSGVIAYIEHFIDSFHPKDFHTFLRLVQILRGTLKDPDARASSSSSVLLCYLEYIYVFYDYPPTAMIEVMRTGVDVEIRNCSNLTALAWILTGNRWKQTIVTKWNCAVMKETIRLLVEAGADPNAAVGLPVERGILQILEEEGDSEWSRFITDQVLPDLPVEYVHYYPSIARYCDRSIECKGYVRPKEDEDVWMDMLDRWKRYRALVEKSPDQELTFDEIMRLGMPINGYGVSRFGCLPPPLAYAITHEPIETVSKIIDDGACMYGNGFVYKCQFIVDSLMLRPETLELIIDRYGYDLSYRDDYGASLLHYLIRSESWGTMNEQQLKAATGVMDRIMKALPKELRNHREEAPGEEEFYAPNEVGLRVLRGL